MHIANLKEKIVFQRTFDDITYEDFLTTHAYMNGMSTSEYFQTKAGGEFYLDYAGTEGQIITTVTCRYQKKLMQITPQQYRIKHTTNDGDIYYELLTAADDVQLRHERVKFRARRKQYHEEEESEEDAETDEDTDT